MLIRDQKQHLGPGDYRVLRYRAVVRHLVDAAYACLTHMGIKAHAEQRHRNKSAGAINVVGNGDKQIGNSGDTFLLYGGTFDASSQAGALALGSGCKVWIQGGDFKEPHGTEITAFMTGN